VTKNAGLKPEFQSKSLNQDSAASCGVLNQAISSPEPTSEGEKISVNFISLGCPKNLVDSEVMLGLLDANDFKINEPNQPATVTVINTCSFIEDSKNESVDTILEVVENKKKGLCDMIVVAGCLAQRYVKELPELLPEVDLFVGTGEYNKLPGLIRHKLAGKKGKTYVEDPKIFTGSSDSA
jgi:ribosomal protein S12 methylthiotransferase